MARQYAPIRLSIWRDAEFKKLTETAQRTYFVAISQPSMNYAGVVLFTPGSWANLAAKSTASRIRRDVKDLADAGFVILDDTTEELWVKGFIKHNDVLKQPNVKKAMKASYEQIGSTTIRRALWLGLAAEHREGMTCPFEPGDGPKGLPKEEGSGLPPAEPIAEGRGEGEGEGVSDVSVSAPEPAPDPSPSPVPQPAPAPTHRTATLVGEDGTPAASPSAQDEMAQLKDLERRAFRWTDRALTDFAMPTGQHLRLMQTFRLVCPYVDDRVIDEAFGWCSKAADLPKTARFLEVMLGEWAEQRMILIPGVAKRKAS